MILILLRYHSRYSDFIRASLKDCNVDDYVFSSDVSFLASDDKEQNILKRKVWPESHEIIIKAVEDATAEKLFDIIVEFKKNNSITNKIKIILVPLIKNG